MTSGSVRIHTKNAQYQKFEVLKTNRNKRFKYRQFLVEGVRNINEAVRGGWTVDAFVYAGGRPLSRWAGELLEAVSAACRYILAPALMEELSGKADTSELLAVVRMRDDTPEAFPAVPSPLFVLFDRPSNKGNLGTVIRSCDALGATGLILTGHGVDPYDIDVIVASMGSFFKLPAVFMPTHDAIRAFIASMKDRHPGFRAIGTSAHAALPVSGADMAGPLLVMIGNETDGLSHAMLELCDESVTIPMAPDSSASSLNVGCAAAVLLYEAGRQRGDRR